MTIVATGLKQVSKYVNNFYRQGNSDAGKKTLDKTKNKASKRLDNILFQCGVR
jgi:hypothetical protein